MPPVTPPEWDQRYREGTTPWDSGIRSRELARVLVEGEITPCRAVELGSGTGTNAVFLAEQGFAVTAIDCSELALSQGRTRATEAGVSIEFIQGDLCHWEAPLQPFEFVFDRACYHCVRRINFPGFLKSLSRLTVAGSRYLMLAGNANEQTEHGPPRVTESEIREDFEKLFEIDFIREIRFEDPGGVDGPLGWSCLMTRRAGRQCLMTKE